jgi:hypothetical protein
MARVAAQIRSFQTTGISAGLYGRDVTPEYWDSQVASFATVVREYGIELSAHPWFAEIWGVAREGAGLVRDRKRNLKAALRSAGFDVMPESANPYDYAKGRAA